MTESQHSLRNDSGPFADRLRSYTQVLHEQAERSGFVAMLLRGTATRRGYALFLANLWPAYDALEKGLKAHASAPGIATLADTSVYRASSLDSDLRALLGSEWRTRVPLLPAGAEYARRIETCSEKRSELLIAHAYVRYLGDLSGGRVLKQVLIRSLQLNEESLSFYDFDVTDIDALRTRYRAAIDCSAGSIDDTEGVLNEAAAAFRLNIDLSQAVANALID
jgi:heme oxygenase (biliverdin-producing, ferredoxin)